MNMLSRFNVNAVMLIAMPRSGEEGVPNRIGDHIAGLSETHGFPFEKFLPRSAAEFASVLDEILIHCQSGMRPVIQLDCHGSASLGLEVGASGEFVSWSTIANLLRPINQCTGNNLVVIMSACHAFEAIGVFTITKHVPYYLLYAPEGIIYEREIELAAIAFYDSLVIRKDFDEMHGAMVGPFRLFHCERVFLLSFARYVKYECAGRGKKARIERLLSEALKMPGIENTIENRRKFRGMIKARLRPTEETVQRFGKIFLGKRDFCASLTEIEAFIASDCA